jgi:hypothetical protein
VHDERGLLYEDTPVALVAKEEAAVRSETARRLVPVRDLAAMVSGGEPDRAVADRRAVRHHRRGRPSRSGPLVRTVRWDVVLAQRLSWLPVVVWATSLLFSVRSRL